MYKCDGLFHEFGNDYEEFESGAGNYTTAIIELKNGYIITPHISMVDFTKAE